MFESKGNVVGEMDKLNVGSVTDDLLIFHYIYLHILLFPAVLSFSLFLFKNTCLAFRIFKDILFEDLDRKLTVINNCFMLDNVT